MKFDITQHSQKKLHLDNYDAHIWILQDEVITSNALIDIYRKSLSFEEQSRCSKFKFSKHRHQSLITRGLVRHVLSQYNQSTLPFQWEFYNNYFGKPYIKNINSDNILYFNVSHTDNLIALVVSRHDKIGIDAERVNNVINIARISKTCFSDQENSDLEKFPENEQISHFYSLWTLKEAYVKACGKGLSIPLKDIEFSFTENHIKAFFSGACRHSMADTWLFWHIKYGAEYRLSLAMNEANLLEKELTLKFFKIPDGKMAVDVNVAIANQSERKFK